MDEGKINEGISSYNVKSQEDAREIFEQFIAVAHVDSVFGQPVTAGEYTVITASEVSVAMGLGYGTGYGSYPVQKEESSTKQNGGGGGGGGGGMSFARPVATISIGPQGVTVVPVLDVTKVALVALTAAGSIFMILMKMVSKSKKWHYK